MATPIRFITCANHSDANRTSASPALIMTSLSCARGPKRRDNGLVYCMNGKTAQLYGITAQSNSLAEILSSNVKAEVFRLLFGLDGQPLHVRELERRSGLAIGTGRQELERLTKLGLIAARAEG